MRRTRLSLRSQAEPISDENVDLNTQRQKQESTPRSKKRTSTINSKEIKDVSPPKLAKSEVPISLSPISEKLKEKLVIDGDKKKSENKFRSARRALCTFNCDLELPGREKEIQELRNFFNSKLEEDESASLYISGSPGTGKSATITKLINSSEFKTKFKSIYVNCTSISSIGSIYKKICAELNLKPAHGTTEKDFLATLESYLTEKRHKTIMLVLDEIDQLMGKKQTVLYRIFEWPSLPDSRIILIGIANQLDLTDRSLSRLQTKCELKPKLMHFPPYTKQQIVEIFTKRLEESGVADLFPPITIQLLAAKVSAVSGDIRRALGIGNRVVELAEAEKRKNQGIVDLKKLEAVIAEEEEPKKDQEEPKKEEKDSGTVQIKEVVSVLNHVYGTASNIESDMEESFPIQQKILICTILLIIKNDKNKDITVGRLHDIYKKICKNLNVFPADQSEFISLCSLAETRGIIRMQKKKEPRFHRLFLEWDENEIYEALKDKQMITSILGNRAVLNLKK